MLLRITHVHDAHPPRYVLLEERGSYVIGSGGSDIVLADSTVLAPQVRITLDGGQLVVEDLGGTGETFVDDERIDGPIVAELGAWIRIGETILQVSRGVHRPVPKVFEDRTETPAERTFLAALRDHPADDATREVYADWLEGEGYAVPSQFVRLELLGGADIERSEIVGDIVQQTSLAWRALICRSRIAGCTTYDCPRSWQLLSPTEMPLERVCGSCSRIVRFCTSAGSRERGPVSYDAQVPARSMLFDEETTGRRPLFDPDSDILDDD